MSIAEIIKRKKQELAERRDQMLRDLDAISGALQILEELETEITADETHNTDGHD